MKQITVIAASIAFAFASACVSSAWSQSPAPITTLRRIPVSARTITALSTSKKYVVDLTQRGVVYEFDPKSGQIDFSRVMVRTTQGEVAIGSWLERTLLKGKLADFKYASQSFSLGSSPLRVGTQPKGNLQSRTSTSNFQCNREACECKTYADCLDLADSLLCGVWGCVNENGVLYCACIRASQ